MNSLRQEEIADLHLITGDLPLRDNDSAIDLKRMGQKPTWLDLRKICPTKLNLHHHWDLFKMRMQGVTELEASNWRDRILPTFNSIGIETQLVTLAPELTDTFIYVRYIRFSLSSRPFLLLSCAVQRRLLPHPETDSKRFFLAALWFRLPHAK
jgi:hypothetical protein